MATSDLIWQSSNAPTHGTIGDINTMLISPDNLGMAQDVIIDTSGVLRSRGTITSYTTDTFTTQTCPVALAESPSNPLVSTGALLLLADPTNANGQIAKGTTSTALTGFVQLTAATNASNLIAATSIDMQFSFASLPNDQGKVFCGLSYRTNNNWAVPFLWGGNAVTSSTTTTGTAATTVGSKTVTGVGTAWTSALIGTYLYIGTGADQRLVGQVDSVTSTTVILLRKGALGTQAAATPNFYAIRYPFSMVYKGRITTNTSSAVVVGSNTKFNSSGPAGGAATYITTGIAGLSSGFLFRYSDGAYVGTITSVQNDTTLTLVTNAAVAMVNEEYYITLNINSTPQLAISSGGYNNFCGSCVEQYADRYWYGGIAASDQRGAAGAAGGFFNSVALYPFLGPNSLMFTKKNDPECLDMSPVDGDILKLPTGTKPDNIRALTAIRGGMVVNRGFDTFFLTGYSPDTFRLIKILDDGAYGSGSIKALQDGVVWAGQQSVYYFDGTRVIDLLQNHVKRFYRRTCRYLGTIGYPTPNVGVANDHIFISYYTSSTLPLIDKTWPYKNTTKTFNALTMVINMSNGAVSFFTNLFVTNSVMNYDGTPLLLTSNAIINANLLLNDSATGANNFDSVTSAITTFTSGTQIGPDVMFETTKITLGDATLLKFFKRFLMNYTSDVSMSATIIGTNTTTLDFPNLSTGTVSSDVFAVSSGTGILHRLRFLVRTPAVVIRVYQTATITATSQRFKCFWWALGGKKMRQGRVQP